MIDIEVLHRVANTLAERKEASPDSSYVSSLFHKGTDAICKKVAEEAAETMGVAVGTVKSRASRARRLGGEAGWVAAAWAFVSVACMWPGFYDSLRAHRTVCHRGAPMVCNIGGCPPAFARFPLAANDH